MARTHFARMERTGGGFNAVVVVTALLVAAALGAAYYMEHHGHIVTGMNNQVVWGLPHVFAVFLIVAASGVLNVASVGSVFGKAPYKPLARLSGVMAITLLAGGLAVLVLDLGRPDRLIVAMTRYNFTSIFAWNIFLYTGFLAIVFGYLWFQMERRLQAYARPVGVLAFGWRIILTTGTGSIFGFLVARQAYDAAILAPLFVTLSFAYGLALYLLVLMTAERGAAPRVPETLLNRLKGLLAVFVWGALYFELARHLTNLYAAEHRAYEAWLLAGGNAYTALFWLGQVGLGLVLPLALLHTPGGVRRGRLALASLAVPVGGLVQMYVTIIGGQAYPLQLFPGRAVSSPFADGVVASYAPSLPEALLGMGGIAIALLATALIVRLFPILPTAFAAAEAPTEAEPTEADQPAESEPEPAE